MRLLSFVGILLWRKFNLGQVLVSSGFHRLSVTSVILLLLIQEVYSIDPIDGRLSETERIASDNSPAFVDFYRWPR